MLFTAMCSVLAGGAGFAIAGASAGASARGVTSLAPALSYAIERRADRSWAAWDADVEQYAQTYARPTRWTVTLDGCRSTGSITQYQWMFQRLVRDARGQLVPDATALPATLTTARCSRNATLTQLGAYRLSLTVSSADGQTATASRNITFRDLLVVSIGDSLSSGEGNPDQPAPRSGNLVTGPGVWSDRQCHRSAKSWSGRLARELESASTTVTFLNYACSGAATRHLVADSYRGIESGRLRLPQLEAVRTTLGDPLEPATRTVDALLVTVGINDLGFSAILEACAHSFYSPIPKPKIGTLPGTTTDCTETGAARNVVAGLKALPERYDLLDAAIGTTVRAAGVYIVELPSRLFTDSDDDYAGCGAFELGMRAGEARWISARGDDLNSVMRAAAKRNEWTYVGGVRDAFRRKGYCAKHTWFRTVGGSEKVQGNKTGAAHPTAEGHAKIAELALKALRLDRPPRPPQRVHVRVKAAYLADGSSADLRKLCKEDADAPNIGSDRFATTCYRIRLVAPGAWERLITGSGVVGRGHTGAPLPLGRTHTFTPPLTFDVVTFSNTVALWASTRFAYHRIESFQIPTKLVDGISVLRRVNRWQAESSSLTASNGKASLRIEYAVGSVTLLPRPDTPNVDPPAR